MKNAIISHSIGTIKTEKGRFSIQLEEEYINGLVAIEGFSHLQIVWWGSLSDNLEHRTHLLNSKPYKKGPDSVGVFATRSQFRPNPILITNIFVEKIDFKKGIIYTPYIDAENDTPLLDIKPYHFYQRVKNCSSPDWCEHWPSWYEEAAEFDWEAEFNF